MFGLVRVGVVSPKLAVADCEFNKNEIIKVIDDAWAQDVQILVFPELAVTGASCGDLFYQRTLLENAKKALAEIVAATEDKKMLAAVGLPVVLDNKIFNAAAVLGSGRIWGVVPKAVSDGKRQFAAYDKAENDIGRKADKNRKIYNGMLKTYFYQFLGPKPPKKPREK